MNNYASLFVFDGDLELKSWLFLSLALHTAAQNVVDRCAVLSFM
jgi:hypothetical protein